MLIKNEFPARLRALSRSIRLRLFQPELNCRPCAFWTETPCAPIDSWTGDSSPFHLRFFNRLLLLLLPSIGNLSASLRRRPIPARQLHRVLSKHQPRMEWLLESRAPIASASGGRVVGGGRCREQPGRGGGEVKQRNDGGNTEESAAALIPRRRISRKVASAAAG